MRARVFIYECNRYTYKFGASIVGGERALEKTANSRKLYGTRVSVKTYCKENLASEGKILYEELDKC